jgi:hypothetical protein
MNKIKKALIGAGLAAAFAVGGSVVAPATVAPVESASAVCLIAVPSKDYRVKVNGYTSYAYFYTYKGAYDYLHGPNSWTGTIYAKVYIGDTCDYVWQFKHYDSSKTS